MRGPALAFPVAALLGFAYFMTATAITTTLQLNMKNTERATVMPLWFMVFGGTVPIGNLIFGVVIEWIGVRVVLGIGAAFALFLAWWLDLRRLPQSAFLAEADGGEPFTPSTAESLTARIAFATRSRPTARLALTSTTSSGPERAERAERVVGGDDAVAIGSDRDQLDAESLRRGVRI